LLTRPADDRECAGLQLVDVAAGALWLLLQEYVRERTRFGQQLPEGITLLAHPSVTHSLLCGLEMEFGDFGAGHMAGMPPVFPPELPVMLTTALGKGEWRLVTIIPVPGVAGGVMP
jgi:hypothetical protein